MFERKRFYRQDSGMPVPAYSDPLHFHIAGLSYTATGYGEKIPTQWKTKNGKGQRVRIYATCYSNVASLWFIERGRKVYITEG